MSFLTGSAPKAKTKAKKTLDKAQSTAEQSVLQYLEGGPGGAGPASTAAVPYTGELAAPLQPLQTASLSGMEALTAAMMDPNSAIGKSQAQATGVLSDIMTRGPQDVTDYFNKAIAAPLEQTFEEQTLPKLLASYGGSAGGPFGSARMTAENLATRDLTTTLGQDMSTVAYKAYQDDISNKLQASQDAMKDPAIMAGTLQELLQGGATQQATVQNQDSAAYAEFQRQQQQNQQRLNSMLQFLGIPTTSVNTTVTPGTSGLLSGLLTGFASNPGTGSFLTSLFSGGSAAAGGTAASAASSFLPFLGL